MLFIHLSSTTKRLALLVFTISSISQLNAMNAPKGGMTPAAKAGLQMAGSAGAIWISNRLRRSEVFQSLCHKLGFRSHGAANIVGLSTALLTQAILEQEGDYKKGLKKFGVRAPVAGLVGKAVTNKSFREAIKDVPIIGGFFTCPEEHKCPGICPECAVTTIVLSNGVYAVTDGLINSYVNPYFKIDL